ncbi:MAG TPA: hypothetical protein VGQ48_04290 [Gemmatimonadales bacterium]|nr:hypothetical protein [Gemmatimonadales bacterium]
MLTAGACRDRPVERAISVPRSPGPASASPGQERAVPVGKEGRLYAPSGAVVYVGADREAAERAQAGDAATIQELVAAGRLFGVPNRTRVTVLTAGAAQRLGAEPAEIRILEGPHAGRRGWVPYGWIR